jgi:hypothetical protein
MEWSVADRWRACSVACAGYALLQGARPQLWVELPACMWLFLLWAGRCTHLRVSCVLWLLGVTFCLTFVLL